MAKASDGTQEKELEKTIDLCGHINRHSYGVDGKPDELSCDLPLGHEGNHGAWHYEEGTQLSSMLTDDESQKFEVKYMDDDGKPLYAGTIRREWNDMAGIPANEIKPNTPGIEIINASHLFPQQQANEISDLKKQVAELSNLLKQVADAKEK